MNTIVYNLFSVPSYLGVTTPWLTTLQQQKECSRVKGFTLIELVVTLSVFSILVMIAIPSFHSMLQNNRLNTSSGALVKSLNYARSIALNSVSNVIVCPINQVNTTNCGSDWSAGWIVATQPSSGTATLLHSEQNAPTTGLLITANINSVTFDEHGLASNQSNFTLCDSRGSTYAQSVEVMATGFIQQGATPGVAIWNNGVLTCP